MNYKEHIESDPKILLGKPRIKGTRIAVELILFKLSEGFSVDDLLKAYPRIKQEEVLACVAYAAAVVESEEVIKVA